MHFVYNARRSRHEIQIVFPLQPFLNDLQMQKSQKSTTEAESERDGRLCFKLQRRII